MSERSWINTKLLDEQALAAAWHSWVNTSANEVRERLFAHYLPLVNNEARKILRSLPSHIQFDDLVSSGHLGLLDAFNKFDFGRGVRFDSYAKIRIHGAIIDGLRRTDPAGRGGRSRINRLGEVEARLVQELQATPSHSQIAAAMGITDDEYARIRTDAHQNKSISLDGLIDSTDTDSDSIADQLSSNNSLFDQDMFHQDTSDLIAGICSRVKLTKQQRIIMILLYVEGIEPMALARLLNCTPSWITHCRRAILTAILAELPGQRTEIDQVMERGAEQPGEKW